MVVEQVDEATEGFGRPIALGGLVQQVDQCVVDVVATGVGLLQHAANYSGLGGIPEQRCAQPTLSHHGFQ